MAVLKAVEAKYTSLDRKSKGQKIFSETHIVEHGAPEPLEDVGRPRGEPAAFLEHMSGPSLRDATTEDMDLEGLYEDDQGLFEELLTTVVAEAVAES